MEKEKILQRYRQEGVDEGREEVNRRGDDAGFYAMCVLALLLMIYQAFTGQVFGDVAAMLFVFCSVGAFAGTGLTGTGPLWAWAFLPALCAWDAWDGICGTRCKKDRRRWKAPPACLPLPHRVADLGDKFFWVPGLVGTDVVDVEEQSVKGIAVVLYPGCHRLIHLADLAVGALEGGGGHCHRRDGFEFDVLGVRVCALHRLLDLHIHICLFVLPVVVDADAQGRVAVLDVEKGGLPHKDVPRSPSRS